MNHNKAVHHDDTALNNKNNKNAICLKLLSTHPLFANLTHQEIEELFQLMEEVQYKAGDNIVIEDEVVDSFFIIRKGKAEVIQKKTVGADVENVIQATLEEGEAIGLDKTGLFAKHGKRTATVIALTDMILLRMDIWVFNIFITKHPDLNKILDEATEQMLKLSFIKQIYPFLYLNADEINLLLENIKEIYLPDNTIIFKHGDPADSCYLIQNGMVEVFVTEDDGTKKQLAILQQPELLGETALLVGGTYNTAARTLSACHFLVLEGALISELLKSSQSFSESMMGFMIRRFRPTRNKDINILHHISERGNHHVMLYNTISHQYYPLTDQAWFIWQQLDSIQTIHDLTILVFKKYRVFAPEMILNLLESLAETGFISIPSIETSSKNEIVYNTFAKKIKKYIGRITQVEYSFTHTDNLLTKMYHNGIFIFYTWPMQLILLSLTVIGFVIFINSYKTVIQNIERFNPSFYFLLLFLIPASVITLTLHELGHAFTAKKFGYKVQRFSLGWFGFGPIAYTDTSELWVANQSQRIAVDIAGIYVELVLAGCFALVAKFVAHGEISVLLWIFSLLTYYSAFKNLSPIREYDGYSLIEDALDYPSLRKKAIHWLVNIFPHNRVTIDILRKNRVEIFYWTVCCMYLLLSTLLYILIVKSILDIFSVKTIFGISSIHISILFSLALLAIAIQKIWNEIKQYKKSAY